MPSSADALTDLVSAGMANTNPLGVSQLSVLVDLEDLSADGATLDDGSALGTRMLDLLSCTAIVSVILGTTRNDVFVPLALARGRRGASASQWRALVARDRGCIRCGRAPRFCQAHHVHHWRHGGSTDVSKPISSVFILNAMGNTAGEATAIYVRASSDPSGQRAGVQRCRAWRWR